MRALKDFQSIGERAAVWGGVCVWSGLWCGVPTSRWLVQRISVPQVPILQTIHPSTRGGRKEEYLLFSDPYSNLEKSAGDTSAVVTAVLTPDVFRYFMVRFCCKGESCCLFSFQVLIFCDANLIHTLQQRFQMYSEGKLTVKFSSISSFSLSRPNCICYCPSSMQARQLLFLILTFISQIPGHHEKWTEVEMQLGGLRLKLVFKFCMSRTIVIMRVKTYFAVSHKIYCLSHLKQRKISVSQ